MGQPCERARWFPLPRRRWPAIGPCLCLLAIGLAGCSTGKAPSTKPALPTPPPPAAVAPDKAPHPPRGATSRAAVRAEAMRWLGTPHRLGGADSAGMDCSGLVWLVFQNAVGVRLPRVSHEQMRHGRPASLAALRTGDLVFFQTPGNRQVNHVGIYLENGTFIHASTQRGVVVSRLAEPYYTKAYRGARAILRD